MCRAQCDQALDLCTACWQELPWHEQACYQCGVALTTQTTLCARCVMQPPAYDNTTALFRYQQPIEKIINRAKFHADLASARLLGELMADYFSEVTPRPDLLLPVPLHRTRIKTRGYNQALEIARPIAKRLHMPISKHNCRRQRATQAQSSLSAKKRRHNMRNAFQIVNALTVNHIAIIDDVVTTGSTVNELARVLRQQGVKIISVWCVARA